MQNIMESSFVTESLLINFCVLLSIHKLSWNKVSYNHVYFNSISYMLEFTLELHWSFTTKCQDVQIKVA